MGGKIENDILSYKAKDKIYIPEGVTNSRFSYKINGDYVTIITDEDCTTQYTTTYCRCYQYNFKNNILSESFTCNVNNNNPSIPFAKISNDINDSKYIRDIYIQDKGIIMIVLIIGIIFAIFLTKERSSL